jgi:hypothetical protein
MHDIISENMLKEFYDATMHLVDINTYLELIKEAEVICTRWLMCQSWLE